MILKSNSNNKNQKTTEEYIEIWKKAQSDFKFGIRTYTGKEFDFFNLNEDMICIEDIAHSLSHQCRFGGHTKHFYSIAQHSMWMAKQADINQLECLMHDSTEAYLLDVPTPIKRLLPQYKDYENKLHEVISKKFNLIYPYPEIVNSLDLLSLMVEWDGIMINDTINCLTPHMAEKRFLELYEKLKN